MMSTIFSILVGGAFVACTPEPEPAPLAEATEVQPVDVVAILPLTGPAASVGEYAANGLRLAADELNADGEVVRVVIEDSANSAAEGLTAYKRSVSPDTEAVIVAMSGVAKVIAPLADEDGVPMVATIVSDSSINAGRPEVFRAFTGARQEAQVMGEHVLAQTQLQDWMVLAIEDEYGRVGSAQFTEILTEAGRRVVLSDTFSAEASDYGALIARVAATDAEAVYVVGYAKPLGLMLKQLREGGVTLPIYSFSSTNNPKVIGLAGEAAEGITFTTTTYSSTLEQEPTASFVADYQTRYGSAPAHYAAFSADALGLIVAAAEGSGTERGEILQGLAATEDYKGIVSTVGFDDEGNGEYEMTVKRIVGGKSAGLE